MQITGSWFRVCLARVVCFGGLCSLLLVFVVACQDNKLEVVEQESLPADVVAVLPFANTSSDPDNEYFSDGVTEEIINALSGVRGLSVVGRTSTFAFKDSGKDARQIGQALNAGSIVEGSVRAVGNRVRITTQLINAADGYNRWSQTYDRELTDIFAVQDEIATAIVGELRAALGSVSESLVARPTDNIDAYNAYLRGQWLGRQPELDDIEASIELFEEAVALDPGFANAWFQLAFSQVSLFEWNRISIDEARALAEPALARALELDPDLGSAYSVLGLLRQFEGRVDESRRLHDRAVELSPSNSTVWANLGYLHLVSLGQPRAAQTAIEEGVRIDPVWLSNTASLAEALEAQGDVDTGKALLDRLVADNPGYLGAQWRLGRLHASSLGDPATGLRLLQSAGDLDEYRNAAWLPYDIAWLALTLGELDEARSRLADAQSNYPGSPMTPQLAYLVAHASGEPNANAQLLQLAASGQRYTDYQSVEHTYWLRQLAVVDGAAARRVYERLYPELLSRAPSVFPGNLGAALSYAAWLRQDDREADAEALLDRILEVATMAPVAGYYGTGIARASVHAMRDDSVAAGNAFADAYAAGWRGAWWLLESEPLFAPLRASQRYRDLRP